MAGAIEVRGRTDVAGKVLVGTTGVVPAGKVPVGRSEAVRGVPVGTTDGRGTAWTIGVVALRVVVVSLSAADRRNAVVGMARDVATTGDATAVDGVMPGDATTEDATPGDGVTIEDATAGDATTGDADEAEVARTPHASRSSTRHCWKLRLLSRCSRATWSPSSRSSRRVCARM